MTSKIPRSWRLDLGHDGRTITEPEVGPAEHRGTLITIAVWARRERARQRAKPRRKRVSDEQIAAQVAELVDMLGLNARRRGGERANGLYADLPAGPARRGGRARRSGVVNRILASGNCGGGAAVYRRMQLLRHGALRRARRQRHAL